MNDSRQKYAPNFKFHHYDNHERLSRILEKFWDDPRVVALLYGCGAATTTLNFKKGIERTLQLRSYSSTITIQDLVYTGSDKCLTITDIIDTANCDYPDDGLVNAYQIEKAAYTMACWQHGILSEEEMNRAYIRFVYKVTVLSRKHFAEYGLEDLLVKEDEERRINELFGE